MNKQIQYGKYRINDLSELLEAKNPKGVLILEGSLETSKKDGTKVSQTNTWKEAVTYVSGVCGRLEIPHIMATEKDFQMIAQIKTDHLRRIFEQGITSQADLGLYVAGCLCCASAGRENPLYKEIYANYPYSGNPPNIFFSNLKVLGQLFGIDRVFIAYGRMESETTFERMRERYIPEDSYFLV